MLLQNSRRYGDMSIFIYFNFVLWSLNDKSILFWVKFPSEQLLERKRERERWPNQFPFNLFLMQSLPLCKQNWMQTTAFQITVVTCSRVWIDYSADIATTRETSTNCKSYLSSKDVTVRFSKLTEKRKKKTFSSKTPFLNFFCCGKWKEIFMVRKL